MENPFFRNRWNYNPVPIHRRTVPVAPKVVSIPVRFAESIKSRSESATKIQKVFRGFLARKNVKKLAAIEREVNEIDRTLSNESTVESIRRDTKERVKFGEMLMNLLFRLDSVKGVDSGIRNFRKAAIKKAIALQEKVDSIAEFAVDRSSEREKEILDLEHTTVSSSSTPDIPNTYLDSCDELENDDGVESNLPSIEKEGVIIDESNIVPEISGGGDDLVELNMGEDRKQREEVGERMMMEMMERLFEQNEMQTKMIGSLSLRVEQLEKAFVYEMLRRKKKKRSTAIVDTSEKCPKTKKCDTML